MDHEIVDNLFTVLQDMRRDTYIAAALSGLISTGRNLQDAEHLISTAIMLGTLAYNKAP